MLASTALGSLLLWCCSRRERSARSLAGSVSARGAASKHPLGAVIGCQALLARRTGLPRAVEGLRAAVARPAVNRRLLLALAWDTVGLRTRRSRDCAPLPYAHAASPTLEYGPARPSSRPRWLHRLLNAPHCLALPPSRMLRSGAGHAAGAAGAAAATCQARAHYPAQAQAPHALLPRGAGARPTQLDLKVHPPYCPTSQLATARLPVDLTFTLSTLSILLQCALPASRNQQI